MPDSYPAPPPSLYPQPPKAQDSVLGGNALQAIGPLLNAVNAARELRSKQAIGDAYRGAMKPDGSVDMERLAPGLQNPDAAYGLPNAAAGIAALRGQDVANEASRFELQAKQQQWLTERLGTLADKPNPTMEDVRDFVARAAKNTNIPAPVLNHFARVLRGSTNLKQDLIDLRNMGLGNAATDRVTGAPDAAGAPTTITKGQANYQGATPGGPPGITTALPPGAGEAKQAAGAASGGGLARAREESLDYQRHVYPLEQAIPALEKLGTTGTGPGTETFNNVKSFLLSAGIPGIDPDKIKTFDEARKYLTDFVNQTGNSSTNDKLAAAFAGNPNVNISNAAAVDVAKAALSLRRMKQAQLTAFEKSGLPESDYAKEASKWNLAHDPRVYGFDLMSPAQRTAVLNSMPKNKRDLFKMDVLDAVESGMMRAPAAEGK